MDMKESSDNYIKSMPELDFGVSSKTNSDPVIKFGAGRSRKRKRSSTDDYGNNPANRAESAAIAYSVAAILLLLTLLSIVLPKEDFSENENRSLASFPAFSFSGLKDGSFMEALQGYLSDHFPFRDSFMTLRTEAERSLGKREINGIFLADDGFLIEDYELPQNPDRTAAQFGKFADTLATQFSAGAKAPNVYLMLVPTAITIYEDKLPPYSQTESQIESMNYLYEKLGFSNIATEAGRDTDFGADDEYLKAFIGPSTLHPNMWRVPAAKALISAKNVENGVDSAPYSLFYQTDHHWTSEGAYYGYVSFCQTAGIVPHPLSDFKKEIVTNEFRGTIYSKLDDTSVSPDSITLYTREEDRLSVSYPDTGEVTDSLYNLSYLDKKDKYSLFLNNLHPLVEIKNESSERANHTLLVIKDSYANSMIPFLTGHYSVIYVFDTRYYRMGPSSFISSLMSKDNNEQTIDVLILYNMNTIDTDLGIGGIF